MGNVLWMFMCSQCPDLLGRLPGKIRRYNLPLWICHKAGSQAVVMAYSAYAYCMNLLGVMW